MNKIIFITLTLMLLLSSCSPKIGVGTYTTSSNGKILFAGTDMNILPNKRVEILHWTDTGNEYGEGSYNQSGKKFKILFDDVNMIKAHYTESSIDNGYGDAHKFVIKGNKEMLGATVRMMDKGENVIMGAIVDGKGICMMNIPFDIECSHLTIEQFGYETLKIDVKYQASTQYNVILRETFTSFFKQGDILEYGLQKKGQNWILKRGKHEIFLNKKSD